MTGYWRTQHQNKTNKNYIFQFFLILLQTDSQNGWNKSKHLHHSSSLREPWDVMCLKNTLTVIDFFLTLVSAEFFNHYILQYKTSHGIQQTKNFIMWHSIPATVSPVKFHHLLIFVVVPWKMGNFLWWHKHVGQELSTSTNIRRLIKLQSKFPADAYLFQNIFTVCKHDINLSGNYVIWEIISFTVPEPGIYVMMALQSSSTNDSATVCDIFYLAIS